MSPDSKGEMNQEATGEEEEEEEERESTSSAEQRRGRHVRRTARRKAPMPALRRYSLGTTALRGGGAAL